MNCRNKFNSTLANINKDIGKLRKNFAKLKIHLAIFRTVHTKKPERLVSLELQCWNNCQYSRRESLQITGLTEVIKDGRFIKHRRFSLAV